MLFVLFSGFASAEYIEGIGNVNKEGYVSIGITNRAPRVKSLALVPEEVYEDQELVCEVVVADEHQKSVELKYIWYQNGVLLSDQDDRSFSGFKEGDEISCVVYPIDHKGKVGDQVLGQAAVLIAPASVKFGKAVLNMVGVDKGLAELAEQREDGMLAMTGFVVKEGGSSGTSQIFMLAILVGVLVLVNVNLLLRLRLKKSVSKHL